MSARPGGLEPQAARAGAPRPAVQSASQCWAPTGSVGPTTLDLIAHPDAFEIVALTAQRSRALAERAVRDGRGMP